MLDGVLWGLCSSAAWRICWRASAHGHGQFNGFGLTKSGDLPSDAQTTVPDLECTKVDQFVKTGRPDVSAPYIPHFKRRGGASEIHVELHAYIV